MEQEEAPALRKLKRIRKVRSSGDDAIDQVDAMAEDADPHFGGGTDGISGVHPENRLEHSISDSEVSEIRDHEMPEKLSCSISTENEAAEACGGKSPVAETFERAENDGAESPKPEDERKKTSLKNQEIPRPRKRTKKQLEEMHAESQRLLRETTNVSFEQTSVVHIPMNGLLAKLRARKAQLGWNPTPKEDSHRDDAADEQILQENPVETRAPGSPSEPTDTIEDPLGKCSNTFRQASDDTQDIFGDSHDQFEQLQDNSSIPDAPSVNLHLETETENPDSKMEEDYQDIEDPESQDKNLGRSQSEDEDEVPQQTQRERSKPRAMAFVDCEAEVEDEDDIHAKDSEEEDEDDDYDDMLEIIEPAKPELDADIRRRAELHRKWLERQDDAETNNLLCKLMKKTGNDEIGDVLPVDDVEESSQQNDSRAEGKKTSGFDYDMFMRQAFVEESVPQTEQEASDDEETERQILRQRIINVSEEQAAFTCPAEDESSRRMLGFIKKLNVASTTRTRQDARRLVPGVCQPKPAFANRSSSVVVRHTASLNSTSSRSRSFIFRDESNSSSGFLSNEKTLAAADASNAACVTPSSSSSSTSSSSVNAAGDGGGPSLFSILRQQSHQSATTDEQSMADKITIFAKLASKRSKFKPKVGL